MSEKDKKKFKTQKRETAWFLLGFLVLLSFPAVFDENESAIRLIEIFIVPIFSFATLAFGADAYAKQIKKSDEFEREDNGHGF